MADGVDAEILKEAIERSWSQETCQEPIKWTCKNKASGQCVPTALVVNDLHPGTDKRKILRLDLAKSSNPTLAGIRSHYFNEIDGKWVDFSKKQFKWLLPEAEQLLQNTNNISERKREDLLLDEGNRRRYLILRKNVEDKLAEIGEKKV